jgi:hypothetical protein
MSLSENREMPQYYEPEGSIAQMHSMPSAYADTYLEGSPFSSPERAVNNYQVEQAMQPQEEYLQLTPEDEEEIDALVATGYSYEQAIELILSRPRDRLLSMGTTPIDQQYYDSYCSYNNQYQPQVNEPLPTYASPQFETVPRQNQIDESSPYQQRFDDVSAYSGDFDRYEVSREQEGGSRYAAAYQQDDVFSSENYAPGNQQAELYHYGQAPSSEYGYDDNDHRQQEQVVIINTREDDLVRAGRFIELQPNDIYEEQRIDFEALSREQERIYGFSMYDSLNEQDEMLMEALISQGYSTDAATLIIFNQKDYQPRR